MEMIVLKRPLNNAFKSFQRLPEVPVRTTRDSLTEQPLGEALHILKTPPHSPLRMGLWGAASRPDSTSAQVEEEQDVRSNQSSQGPDLFSKEIRRPSHLQVGVEELLPRRAFAIGDRRQAVTPEHVAYVAGAGMVAEFLQLPGETFVTPRVVFSGETNNQGFGVLRFARSSGLCRRVVVSPFLLLLAAVPAQKSFRFGDGNDLRKPSLDGQAKLDENQPVGFAEGHAGGEFAAGGSVLLAGGRK